METKDKNSIVVKDITKKFKVYYDKPNTLKERLVFWKNNKTEQHTVLENINLNVALYNNKRSPLQINLFPLYMHVYVSCAFFFFF